jgi:glutathione S-transferase
MNTPLLYTFRRCPYAIRARLAIAAAGATVQEHEISLRNKPAAMLAISPKGTVPVLQLADGLVLEQSLDIMRWALRAHDPENWLHGDTPEGGALIETSDGEFKQALDRYKYANRFPEQPAAAHRDYAMPFLHTLEARLAAKEFLLADYVTFADAAIFPFVRQFAAVDRDWFDASGLRHLAAWLTWWESSALFAQVMQK